MEASIKDKTCESCKYYSQHFARYEARYHYVFCGHCINTAPEKMHKNRKPNEAACEDWDRAGDIKEEKRKSVGHAIINMDRLLEELLYTLKDE